MHNFEGALRDRIAFTIFLLDKSYIAEKFKCPNYDATSQLDGER